MAMVVLAIVRVILMLSLLFGRHLLRQEHLLILSFFMVIIFLLSLSCGGLSCYLCTSEVSAGTDVRLSPTLTDLMSVSALLHWCSQEKKRHDHAVS